MSKKKILTAIIVAVLIAALIAGGYFAVLHSKGLSLRSRADIQKNYAEFLIEKNDDYINLMIQYAEYTQNEDVKLTEELKEDITDNLIKQQKVMELLEEMPPDETNSDYREIYDNMLKLYGFYIQGEVMIADYLFGKDASGEDVDEDTQSWSESYIMGDQLCNMIGNSIIDCTAIINDVRGTSIESEFIVIPEEVETEANTH